MKKIIFLIIFIILSFGENINKQILKKLDKIDNGIKIIKKEIDFTKKEMRIRFEAMDKRFEIMQKSMDNRFEAMDKKFEMMQKSMNNRFEAMQHYMDKRFETLISLIVALITGIFTLIGFMIWDRKTVVEKTKKECMNEIKEKADKEYVDRLVKAMNELIVLKDEKAMDVFRKYGLL